MGALRQTGRVDLGPLVDASGRMLRVDEVTSRTAWRLVTPAVRPWGAPTW
jgi:hypothetical protein